jgi:hypothetical protein
VNEGPLGHNGPLRNSGAKGFAVTREPLGVGGGPFLAVSLPPTSSPTEAGERKCR